MVTLMPTSSRSSSGDSTNLFSSRQPVGFVAKDTNLYRYVGNSPGIYIDPAGLQQWPIDWGDEWAPEPIPYDPLTPRPPTPPPDFGPGPIGGLDDLIPKQSRPIGRIPVPESIGGGTAEFRKWFTGQCRKQALEMVKKYRKENPGSGIPPDRSGIRIRPRLGKEPGVDVEIVW